MIKYAIPSVLAGIVVIATIFAFAPVMEASTVHTTIQANTIRISEDVDNFTTVDRDIIFTCPAASDGCRILEVWIDENSNNALQIDTVDANINGQAVTGAIDLIPDFTVTNTAALVPQVGGIAMGGGDTITLIVNDGATGSTDYTVIVIAEVEGATDISTTISGA